MLQTGHRPEDRLTSATTASIVVYVMFSPSGHYNDITGLGKINITTHLHRFACLLHLILLEIIRKINSMVCVLLVFNFCLDLLKK
jgi:hypothetical protein